ncbi:hypothetical protein DRB17_17105 [Ferruginivarius sediminum]|uniref:Uncharacterized protein n=1 Tax=Ferruginivarius sediminum TaxID=2661937 RepID=A0A369TCN5_9PROT|nr:hypothetical protein DRB17_17105 [Ferruginivarius sediminum]
MIRPPQHTADFIEALSGGVDDHVAAGVGLIVQERLEVAGRAFRAAEMRGGSCQSVGICAALSRADEVGKRALFPVEVHRRHLVAIRQQGDGKVNGDRGFAGAAL